MVGLQYLYFGGAIRKRISEGSAGENTQSGGRIRVGQGVGRQLARQEQLAGVCLAQIPSSCPPHLLLLCIF